jgi:hypothetical protein
MISWKLQNKNKQLKLKDFLFLAFVNMAVSDLRALQAALSLPLERLGEVRRRAISCTPIPALLGGLLSENEGGQLSLRPRPPLKQWEHCLRLSKDPGRLRFGCVIRPESLFLHLSGKPFVNTPGWLLWELRRSHETGVNRSGRHVMGLSKFPDILSPVILPFGSDIGDFCDEISLIRRRRFFYFLFR